jgi:trigger factor
VKVTSDKPEPGVATLTVELPPEDYERALDQAWRRVANRVNIPGFRRGKAPRALVERYAGPATIDQEAIGRLLPESYDKAVEEAGLAPIERPQFDVVQMERGQPLIFKATVALRPAIDLDGYQQIEIKPDTVEVREEEVQNVLDRLRETQAQWVPVEDRGVEMGDQIIADVQMAFADEGEGKPARTTNREDAEVIIGQNGYPEGFDQAVLGARAGETRTFRLQWPFGPQQEGEAPDVRTADFTVTVKDVKRKELPALDDEFAKSLGEHETVEQLTHDVRRRLRDDALRAARTSTENKAVDAAIEKATFEIAERLIEAETDALVEERRRALEEQRITLERYLQLSGRSEEEWRSEMREQAIRQLKARLILDELAEREGLTATPEEVQEEIETTALGYGDQAQEVRRTLSTDENRRRITTSLRRRKAIERLVALAGGYPQDTTGIDAADAGAAIAQPGTTESAADAASAVPAEALPAGEAAQPAQPTQAAEAASASGAFSS